MICLDTTFLVDLWRGRDSSVCSARELLQKHRAETFAVPVHAAGEFLEGAAWVSEDRLRHSMQFLRLFQIGDVNIETAVKYAQILAHLRKSGNLTGRSKPDMWIAAWALEHGAALATRNAADFAGIPGLVILGY